MIAAPCATIRGSACGIATVAVCLRCRWPYCHFHGAAGYCDACAVRREGGAA